MGSTEIDQTSVSIFRDEDALYAVQRATANPNTLSDSKKPVLAKGNLVCEQFANVIDLDVGYGRSDPLRTDQPDSAMSA